MYHIHFKEYEYIYIDIYIETKVTCKTFLRIESLLSYMYTYIYLFNQISFMIFLQNN